VAPIIAVGSGGGGGCGGAGGKGDGGGEGARGDPEYTSSAGVSPLPPDRVAKRLLTRNGSNQRLPVPDTCSVKMVTELPGVQPGSETISDTIDDMSGEMSSWCV
jgi:hypothetical protein